MRADLNNSIVVGSFQSLRPKKESPVAEIDLHSPDPIKAQTTYKERTNMATFTVFFEKAIAAHQAQ